MNETTNNEMNTSTINGVKVTILNGKLVQHFPAGDVRVLKANTGGKALQIFPLGYERRIGSYVVPVEIARLAAGRDAWLRDVLIKCECGVRTTIGQLECDVCPDCYAKLEAELN